jgi:hypothetical protein
MAKHKRKEKIDFKITLTADECRALNRALYRSRAVAVEERDPVRVDFFTKARDLLEETIQNDSAFVRTGLQDLGWTG